MIIVEECIVCNIAIKYMIMSVLIPFESIAPAL